MKERLSGSGQHTAIVAGPEKVMAMPAARALWLHGSLADLYRNIL